jgi:protein NDRG1
MPVDNMVVDDNDDVFENQEIEEVVESQYGTFHCIMTGPQRPNRPVILTLHDVGLNHKSCFETLFNNENMLEITRHFAVCHVDAPGQHEGASTLSAGYAYPTMDQLSEGLTTVLKHYGFRSVIGVGVGAGANVLAKFALNHPDLVEGLVLININANAETFIDTMTHKITDWTHTLTDSIISHLFGKDEIQTNLDLIATYRHYINTSMNQTNLGHFWRSYNSRRALDVERPVPDGNVNVRTLKCTTLLVVGDSSPAVEDVVDCNSKLNPTRSTLLKMSDCGGQPQVDQPAKLIEALKYFIQGMGYMSSTSMTRLRSASGSSVASYDSGRTRLHSSDGRSRLLSDGRRQRLQSDEQRGRSHTDVSMDSVSHMIPPVTKTAGLAC